jgi:hypothetical protein
MVSSIGVKEVDHMLPNNTQFQELRLLLNYSQETNPAERKKLEDMIWKNYGTENTVLALDMFGFSKLLTRKYGIIHYLSMIRRMQLTVEPIIIIFPMGMAAG